MKCYMTGKPCDYYQCVIENRHMFIVSPFGFPFDSLYRDGSGVQRDLDEKCHPDHATGSEHAMRLGSIMCQGICKEIIEKQYLFADISLPNPNVYYELGLAYALSRGIFLVRNKSFQNSRCELLTREFEKGGAYTEHKEACIEYRDLQSLTEAVHRLELKNAVRLTGVDHSWDYEKPKIIVLENGDGSISGLYETIITGQQAQYVFDPELLKVLTGSERESFSLTRDGKWKSWTVQTLRITDSMKLNDIVQAIAGCKVCVVDTTAYRSEYGPITNPYMYFCLGVAHGFEKEAIPITNTAHSSGAPFDVKGLWHIFFSKEEELKTGFSKIIPRISIESHKECENAPFRKIWSGFLADRKILSVIYCGRSVAEDAKHDDPKYENRGPRTNVDSWDAKAVSQVSFYLAQKNPTALIKPGSPNTRSVGKPTEAVQKRITEELKTDYANCIIVGSPDVNDYAEVVLAKLYGVSPYDTRPEVEKTVVLNGGFIFQKNNIKFDIRSSFYRKSSNLSVITRRSVLLCDHETTYGVLTISENPFAPGQNVMVIAGFTGLATCALMELMIGSEPETSEEEKIKLKLRKQLKEEVLPQYQPEGQKPFTVVVEFKYGIKTVEAGDNRYLTDVHVRDVLSPKAV